jgi:hypothetical protein
MPHQRSRKPPRPIRIRGTMPAPLLSLAKSALCACLTAISSFRNFSNHSTHRVSPRPPPHPDRPRRPLHSCGTDRLARPPDSSRPSPHTRAPQRTARLQTGGHAQIRPHPGTPLHPRQRVQETRDRTHLLPRRLGHPRHEPERWRHMVGPTAGQTRRPRTPDRGRLPRIGTHAPGGQPQHFDGAHRVAPPGHSHRQCRLR